jgi:hypothetical protein
MSRAESTNTRFIDTPEYRALVYKMYRKEGERWPGGPLYRLPAIRAWRMSREYVEALQS